MRRDALYDLVDGVHALTLLRKDVQRLVPGPCSMAARGVLATLVQSGPVRMGALAELTRVDASVTSRQVAQLHSEGLVERVPDPLDGRSSLVAVTDTGREELNRLRDAVVLSWDGELADWSDQELSDLVRMLRRLQSDLDGVRPPAGPRPARPPETRHLPSQNQPRDAAPDEPSRTPRQEAAV